MTTPLLPVEPVPDHFATAQVLDELARARDAGREGPCIQCGVPTTHYAWGPVTVGQGATFGGLSVPYCLVCVVGRHWLDVLDYRAMHPEDPVVQQVWDAQQAFGLPDDAAQRATADRLVARLEAARVLYVTAAAKDAALVEVLWPAVVEAAA
jgi:hypothetical protein